MPRSAPRLKAAVVFSVSAAFTSGCGHGDAAPASGSAGQAMGGTGAPAAGAGMAGARAGETGDAGTSSAGGLSSGGQGGGGGSGGGSMHPPALGTPGVWEDVTSDEMDPALFEPPSGFGVGNIRVDPARPTDLYAGGYGSIWKSTDYGLTWSKLDSEPNPPYLPLGHVLAVAGTTPPTLWMANVNGEQKVFKSTDGGLSFTLTGVITVGASNDSFYSIVVDPNDPTHLLTGLHEQDNLLESKDGGETWQMLAGTGWPTGGKSWFPFFVEAGNAAETSQTWFAIAQDGGSAVITRDGGATWTQPQGLEGLQHPHGGSGFFQDAAAMFVAGVQGPGEGVYRSTDLGLTWTQVTQGSGGVVWGTPKNLYVMWGWACAGCGLNEGGPRYQTAPQPGTSWSMGSVPPELDWGPNSVAVTSDGARSIIVGSMWSTGLWRYVEP
jgi:hypothetical protein